MIYCYRRCRGGHEPPGEAAQGVSYSICYGAQKHQGTCQGENLASRIMEQTLRMAGFCFGYVYVYACAKVYVCASAHTCMHRSMCGPVYGGQRLTDVIL